MPLLPALPATYLWSISTNFSRTVAGNVFLFPFVPNDAFLFQRALMEAANTRAPKVVKEKKKMRGRSKVSGRTEARSTRAS